MAAAFIHAIISVFNNEIGAFCVAPLLPKFRIDNCATLFEYRLLNVAKKNVLMLRVRAHARTQ